MNTRHLGPSQSGVWVHTPEEGGPGNDFVRSVVVGRTELSAQEVHLAAYKLGMLDFQSCTYEVFEHNCGDFAASVCAELGVDPPPSDTPRCWPPPKRALCCC